MLSVFFLQNCFITTDIVGLPEMVPLFSTIADEVSQLYNSLDQPVSKRKMLQVTCSGRKRVADDEGMWRRLC
jgi:hypothetical protein